MKHVIVTALASAAFSLVVVADNNGSTVNGTSVMEVEVFFGGTMLPDMRGKQQVYTRTDRRRIVNEYKAENWLVDKALGQVQSDDIARIDKGLQWILKPSEKSYIECALAGCAPRDLAKEFKPDVENSPAVEEETPAQCVATPTKNDFQVKATGEKREIAGREAEKYQISWIIEAKDESGRVDHFEVEWSMWTTTPTSQMQDAWKIHETFQTELLAKMGAQGNVIAQTMPKEVYMALAGFSGDISKESESISESPFFKEMRKIKGYPLSIKLEMNGEQNTCRPAKEEVVKKEEESSNPLDWFKKKAKDFAVDAATKSFKSSKHEPMVIYQYDVKTIKVGNEKDDLFEVPKGFTLTSRN